VNRSHLSPALRSPCQSGSSYRFRVTANKQPDVGVIYSWRIHSEGLVPQNYSGSIRHSDENGWLPPAPWTVVAGRASCQMLEADVTRAAGQYGVAPAGGTTPESW
jgi:hypothetical protein